MFLPFCSWYRCQTVWRVCDLIVLHFFHLNVGQRRMSCKIVFAWFPFVSLQPDCINVFCCVTYKLIRSYRRKYIKTRNYYTTDTTQIRQTDGFNADRSYSYIKYNHNSNNSNTNSIKFNSIQFNTNSIQYQFNLIQFNTNSIQYQFNLIQFNTNSIQYQFNSIQFNTNSI